MLSPWNRFARLWCDLETSWNYISFTDYREQFLWRKLAASNGRLYAFTQSPGEKHVLVWHYIPAKFLLPTLSSPSTTLKSPEIFQIMVGQPYV